MDANGHSFVVTNPLTPVGPGEDLFIAGASIFEITDFDPPLQRVTVVGINLPPPDTFGPYDEYVATISPTDDPTQTILTLILRPTAGGAVWAGTGFLTFGGTLFPMTATVRPQQDTNRVGPAILEGPAFQ